MEAGRHGLLARRTGKALPCAHSSTPHGLRTHTPLQWRRPHLVQTKGKPCTKLVVPVAGGARREAEMCWGQNAASLPASHPPAHTHAVPRSPFLVSACIHLSCLGSFTLHAAPVPSPPLPSTPLPSTPLPSPPLPSPPFLFLPPVCLRMPYTAHRQPGTAPPRSRTIQRVHHPCGRVSERRRAARRRRRLLADKGVVGEGGADAAEDQVLRMRLGATAQSGWR